MGSGFLLRDINGESIHFLDRLEFLSPYAQRFHLLNGTETFLEMRSKTRLTFCEHPGLESEQMKDVLMLRCEFVFITNPGIMFSVITEEILF